MRSLSDKIEQYLRVLIERSDRREIMIQRAELAETFRCVPSQISYVLSTRFTLAEGFITESRRGGKGFVRIKKLADDVRKTDGLSQAQADRVMEELITLGLLSDREAGLVLSLMKSDVLFGECADREAFRARMIEIVIETLRHQES